MTDQLLTESAKYHNTLVERAQAILHDPSSSPAYRRAAVALLRHEGIVVTEEGVSSEVSPVQAPDMWAEQPPAPKDPWDAIAPPPQVAVEQVTPSGEQEESLESNGGMLLGVQDPLDPYLAPTLAPADEGPSMPVESPPKEAVYPTEVHVPIQGVDWVNELPPTSTTPQPAVAQPSPTIRTELPAGDTKGPDEPMLSIRDRLNAFLGKRRKSDDLFGGVGKVSEMVKPIQSSVQVAPAPVDPIPTHVDGPVLASESVEYAPVMSEQTPTIEATDTWELVTSSVSEPPAIAKGLPEEPTPHIVTAMSDPGSYEHMHDEVVAEFAPPGMSEEAPSESVQVSAPEIRIPREVSIEAGSSVSQEREQSVPLFEPIAPSEEDIQTAPEQNDVGGGRTRPESIATYRAMLAMLDEFSHDSHALDPRQQALRGSILVALEQAEVDIGVVLTQSSVAQGWADLLAVSAEVPEGDADALKNCIVEEIERLARTEVTGGDEPDAEVLWGVWRALTGKEHEHIPESFTDDPKLLHEVEQELLTRLRREEHR